MGQRASEHAKRGIGTFCGSARVRRYDCGGIQVCIDMYVHTRLVKSRLAEISSLMLQGRTLACACAAPGMRRYCLRYAHTCARKPTGRHQSFSAHRFTHALIYARSNTAPPCPSPAPTPRPEADALDAWLSQ